MGVGLGVKGGEGVTGVLGCVGSRAGGWIVLVCYLGRVPCISAFMAILVRACLGVVVCICTLSGPLLAQARHSSPNLLGILYHARPISRPSTAAAP